MFYYAIHAVANEIKDRIFMALLGICAEVKEDRIVYFSQSDFVWFEMYLLMTSVCIKYHR